MIEFPAAWLQIFFFVLGGLLIALSLLYLQNAFRHGGSSAANVLTSGIFIAGIVVILWGTFGLLADVDWRSAFTLQLPNVHFIIFGT